MLTLDWQINVANVGSALSVAVTILWKASAFVSEMKAFREDFETHAREDAERFQRVETRLEDIREFALGRKSF
jgi:hypothetical protein